MDARSVGSLRRRLLAWYDAHRRELPWRGRDVYGVWVSEAMLQQTRVDVATPYYGRWMERFPTVQALAQAHEEEVLQAWAGLGYYSRARNLHSAARVVARDGWPTTVEGWRALPGVGPYTAAAVSSIAQGKPVACVDGNVVRVVARLADERGDVGMKAVRARIERLAQAWLAPTRPGDWNQAVMDLGATVCTPRAPRCGKCPLARLCAARAAGTQAELPRKRRGKPAREERHGFVVIEEAGRILLVRGGDGLLQGMWRLPGGPDEGASGPLDGVVLRQTGVRVRLAPGPAPAVHRFSHRTWRMQVHRGTVVAHAGTGEAEVRWVAREALPSEAVPAATLAALAALDALDPPVAKPKTRPGSARA